MLGTILGLYLGGLLCFGSAMAVHKIIEYGKMHGIVKTDREKEE